MRVPDLILHSAVFLGVEMRGVVKMAGTGFFIGVESEADPGTSHGYLITARHCVDEAKRHGPLLMRMNRKDGTSFTGELPPRWTYHPDEANDVAVLPMAPPASEFLFLVAERPSLATPKTIVRENIGIGDDLVTVGLFRPHSGRTINRPIVRAGVIASMPEEPLEDQNSGLAFDCYLAEIRSIGGLSGSPVWVVIRPGRMSGGELNLNRQVFYLLGLVRGHWQRPDEDLADIVKDEQHSLNLGIAMVTPIQKALDIIDSEEMRKERRKHRPAVTS